MTRREAAISRMNPADGTCALPKLMHLTDTDNPRPVEPLPNARPNPTGHFVLSSQDLSAGADGTGAACSTDRTLGTSMAWATSPQAAFTSAQRNNKLVYLIHVSGNFEQPGFT